jgi:hypothetical protein
MRSVEGFCDLESFIKIFKSLRKSLTLRSAGATVNGASANDLGEAISVITTQQSRQLITKRVEKRVRLSQEAGGMIAFQ